MEAKDEDNDVYHTPSSSPLSWSHRHNSQSNKKKGKSNTQNKNGDNEDGKIAGCSRGPTHSKEMNQNNMHRRRVNGRDERHHDFPNDNGRKRESQSFRSYSKDKSYKNRKYYYCNQHETDERQQGYRSSSYKAKPRHRAGKYLSERTAKFWKSKFNESQRQLFLERKNRDNKSSHLQEFYPSRNAYRTPRLQYNFESTRQYHSQRDGYNDQNNIYAHEGSEAPIFNVTIVKK